jgi:phospholipase C/pimeloyl-ACP methyl ester carboxylesterase
MAGDAAIAYQVYGSGEHRVVWVPGMVSNVEVMWEWSPGHHWLERWGSFATVAAFDKRGTGCSDRVEVPASLEERMEDFHVVLDAVGWDRATIHATSEGGAVACLFAATYPERTESLILQGCFARSVRAPGYEFGVDRASYDRFWAAMAQHWGTPETWTVPFMAPSQVGDDAYLQWVMRLERLSSTPRDVLAAAALNADVDVRRVLPAIRVPTLVAQARQDRVVPVEHGHPQLVDHSDRTSKTSPVRPTCNHSVAPSCAGAPPARRLASSRSLRIPALRPLTHPGAALRRRAALVVPAGCAIPRHIPVTPTGQGTSTREAAMAVTIAQGEETLATATLGSGQSASVTFTPQEGVIDVTAFAFDASPSPTRPRRPGQPGAGGGKFDPNPEDGGDVVGIPPMPQRSEVTASLFPPGATKAARSKRFQIKDLAGDDPVEPLELGVRPEQAGKPWKCVFRNSGPVKAKVSGRVRFVKERRDPQEEPPSEVAAGKKASLPVRHLRPADAADLRFIPTEGEIEVSVFAAEVDLADPTGKIDPNPQDSGDGVGVSQPQDVTVGVSLSAPGAGVVASGQFRSRDAIENPGGPVLRRTVPAAQAGKEWRCRFTNRSEEDVRCSGSVAFVGQVLRTDIPLEVLNHGLRQLIAAVGLRVRLDGKKAEIGVSEELEAFAEDALGGRLDVPLDGIPVEFSDVNLFSLGVRARTDTGRPVITTHARIEARGEEIPTVEVVGVDIADVDVGRLAITVDVELRTVDRAGGRRGLQPVCTVEVDVEAFGRLFDLIGISISGKARDLIAGEVRKVVESAGFRQAVGDYLTQGFVHLAQQGHGFHDLLVEPDRFVVLHTDPDHGTASGPRQPAHVRFPRDKRTPVTPLDAATRANLAKIGSIVVLMQENRSFDHLLGYLSHPDHGRPRLEAAGRRVPDGLTGQESNPFLPSGTRVPAEAYADGDVDLGFNTFIHASAVPFGPHHEHAEVAKQIGRTDGTMDGFVDSFVRRFGHVDPRFAMRFYTDEHLPVTDALAARYAICDRWFCSHPGPTQPNRFCTLSGHTPELENFPLDDPIYAYLRMTTVFDVLTEAGVDWAYYEGDVGFLRMFHRYRLDGTHLRPFARFARDAELGLLPPVTFVDPNFSDIPPAATADDDHPPADLRLGQRLLVQVHDALAASPRWLTDDGGTLLVVTYDEHGGFYDHVPPPGTTAFTQLSADRGEPDHAVAPVHPEGEPFYGPRVPTFVVSPFAGAGTVDSTVFDHTSIIRTILDRFVGEIPAELGLRVAGANNVARVLALDEPRRPGRLDARHPQAVQRRFRDTRRDPHDFHAGMRALAQPRHA